MATAHIEANKEDIAKTVLMPGDPLRAKYIADNYLTDVRLVNSVRNMYGFTGKYKGKEVTVFASGMGIASMGIYSYELFKFYDVENIIRIGTCGANQKDIKLLDVILADSAYSLSTFAKLFNDDDSKIMYASKELNQKIEDAALSNNINIKKGMIITGDVFDVYVDKEKYYSYYPKELETLACEMEAFSLFFMAKILNKKASCLLTVVDSQYDDRQISSEDRQNSLNEMIKIALESCL